jgi:hypothetical protein
MEVGAVTEAVEVTATNPLLATDTTIVGQIVENGSLVKIQEPQGSTVRYMNYFPGVVTESNYHINGLRMRAIGYTVDGMTGKTPGTNTFGDTDQVINPNAEAVQEAAVNSSGMSAEYGNSAGGRMSLVFKSGTNEPHGSLDERYINKNLVQRDYLTQAPDTTPLYYDWFNGAFSGPVEIPKLYHGRNRTFFLFAFGGFLQAGGQPSARLNVPTAAMENGNFNFASNSLTIYNPFTIRQSGSTYISDPFPGNQIPANLIDPVVKYMPERTATGTLCTPKCLEPIDTTTELRIADSSSALNVWPIRVLSG